MSKKRKIIIIFAAVIVVIFAVIFGIYVKNDYDNYIRVNQKFEYEEGMIFSVVTDGDHSSLYNKIRGINRGLHDESIYAVDKLGRFEKVVEINDFDIYDIAISGSCLRIHGVRFIKGEIDYENSIKVIDVNLKELSFNVSDYANGEILGLDKSSGNVITRKEQVVFGIDSRSNLLDIGDNWLAVKNEVLMIGDDSGYKELIDFDKLYNNVELYGDKELVYAVCSGDMNTVYIKSIDVRNETITDVKTITEHVVRIAYYNKELFILNRKELLKLNADGELKVVTTRGKCKFDYFCDVLVGEELIVFGDQGYYNITKNESVSYSMKVNMRNVAR